MIVAIVIMRGHSLYCQVLSPRLKEHHCQYQLTNPIEVEHICTGSMMLGWVSDVGSLILFFSVEVVTALQHGERPLIKTAVQASPAL